MTEQPPRPSVDHRYSQSLERGLEVLGCFAGERTVLGINELADMLGLSRSTTHRYTVTLAELGYLEQTKDRRYRLGLRVTDLGLSALGGTGLRDSAVADLRRLASRTGFTAGLGVLNGDRVLYVERVPGVRLKRHEVDVDLVAGSQLPAWRTAIGKVLLAHLSEDERKAIVGQIDSKAAANVSLELDGGYGPESQFAVDDQQLADGLLGIAAAVRDGDGQVLAAVDLLAPSAKIKAGELIPLLGPPLLSTVNRISRGLGYGPDSQNDR